MSRVTRRRVPFASSCDGFDEMDDPAGADESDQHDVSIEDDGVGLPADLRFGFGLLGMSERIRKLGGHFNVRGGSHAGALIEAVIPLAASA